MKIPYKCEELTEEQKKVLLENFPPPRKHHHTLMKSLYKLLTVKTVKKCFSFDNLFVKACAP